MFYKILIFLTYVSCLSSLQEKTSETNCQESDSIQTRELKNYDDFFSVEFRSAYLYPSSKNFRVFYSGGILWSLEFECKVTKYLYEWISLGYFSKKGRSSARYSKHLVIAPFSTGLKWIYNEYLVQPYFGFGLDFSYFCEEADAPFFIHSVSVWDFGFHFKAGFLVYFVEHFYSDIYIDYFLKCANLHSPSHNSVIVLNPNTSFFSFGGGLGFSF